MSVSYTSYAVIGCELPVDKLYKNVIERHEEHSVPPGARFCPVCGKPAEYIRDIPVFDDPDDQGRIGRFNIVWSTDRRRAFVGTFCSTDDYRDGDELGWLGETEWLHLTDDFDLSELKGQLRDSLQPLGLWDEDRFGLYAVQHCSY